MLELSYVYVLFILERKKVVHILYINSCVELFIVYDTCIKYYELTLVHVVMVISICNVEAKLGFSELVYKTLCSIVTLIYHYNFSSCILELLLLLYCSII